MEKNKPLQAEEMLEQIFYYMNRLTDKKSFTSTILLLTDLGRTLVNSERASFWYWDREKKQYWTLAALGSERIVVAEGTGIIGASIQNKETIVINDPYKDERFNPQVDKDTGFVTKSILCQPVMNAQGKVIGAYQAINKLDEHGESNFDEQDVKHLMLAAVFCGKTLESHILYSEAQIDLLTGLKNRRGFYEYYGDVVRPQLEDNKAALIMCDIDFFKKVNDTYGHNAGDMVLVQISQLLRENMEGLGEVARWGGEEFILLLLGSDAEKAEKLAEKMRRQIEQTVCKFEEQDIWVTMSFGVSDFIKDYTLNVNIECVDASLYKAKTLGRNCVVASKEVNK